MAQDPSQQKPDDSQLNTFNPRSPQRGRYITSNGIQVLIHTPPVNPMFSNRTQVIRSISRPESPQRVNRVLQFGQQESEPPQTPIKSGKRSIPQSRHSIKEEKLDEKKQEPDTGILHDFQNELKSIYEQDVPDDDLYNQDRKFENLERRHVSFEEQAQRDLQNQLEPQSFYHYIDRRPLILPSLARAAQERSRASISNFKEVTNQEIVPDDLNVMPVPPTPEQVEEFKNQMMETGADAQRFRLRIARASNTPYHEVDEIVRLRDVQKFVNNDDYYQDVLSGFRRTITDNPVLRENYERMQGYHGPLLTDFNEYKNRMDEAKTPYPAWFQRDVRGIHEQEEVTPGPEVKDEKEEEDEKDEINEHERALIWQNFKTWTEKQDALDKAGLDYYPPQEWLDERANRLAAIAMVGADEEYKQQLIEREGWNIPEGFLRPRAVPARRGVAEPESEEDDDDLTPEEKKQEEIRNHIWGIEGLQKGARHQQLHDAHLDLHAPRWWIEKRARRRQQIEDEIKDEGRRMLAFMAEGYDEDPENLIPAPPRPARKRKAIQEGTRAIFGDYGSEAESKATTPAAPPGPHRYTRDAQFYIDNQYDALRAPDEEKKFRASQFEQLTQMLLEFNEFGSLKSIVEEPERRGLRRAIPKKQQDEMYITPEDVHAIVTKEQIRSLDPSELLYKMIHTTKYDDILGRNSADLSQTKHNLRKWYNKINNDRIAAEQGVFGTQAFADSVQDFYNNLPEITGLASEQVLKDIEAKAPHPMDADRINQYHQATSAANNLQAILEDFRNNNRKKILHEVNMFNSQMKDIENFIANNPTSYPSRLIGRTMKNIALKLKNGTIDLDEAYSRMNALQHIHKPRLEEDPEKYMRNTMFRTVPVKENVLKTVKDKKSELTEAELSETLRNDNIHRLFSFPGVSFKPHTQTYAAHRVTGNVFDPAKYVKKGLMHDLRHIMTSETNFEQEDFKLQDQTFDRQKLMAEEWQTAFNSRYLNDLQLDPKEHPLLTDSMYFPDPDHPERKKWFRLADVPDDENWTKMFQKEAKFMADLWKWLNRYQNEKPGTRKHRDQSKKALKNLRRYTLPPVKMTETKKVGVTMLHDAPEKEPDVRPDTRLKETPQERADIEKKYAFDNIKYAMKATKEYPESLKTQYGDNVIEYNVQNAEDLKRMKSEVGRLLARGAKLFIIDYKTGRLYPIELSNVYVNQTYIVIIDPEKEGTAFAMNPAIDAIHRIKNRKLPYTYTRHDKAVRMIHKMPTRDFSHDYRHQIREAVGAGLWGHIRKGIKKVASLTGNSIVRQTVGATMDFAHQSVGEAKNFYKQEKRNFNSVYNAGANFARNPSAKTFAQSYYQASNGLGKMVLQPVLSGAREAANLSDYVGNVPGLNIVKFGAEYAIPPLAVADALSHSVKNLGVGSDDKPKYLDAAINAGDALLGTGSLKGVYNVGARVLQTGLKIGDAIADRENH